MGSAMAVSPIFRGLAIGSDDTSPTQQWFIYQQLKPGDEVPKIREINHQSFKYYIPAYRVLIIVPREEQVRTFSQAIARSSWGVVEMSERETFGQLDSALRPPDVS